MKKKKGCLIAIIIVGVIIIVIGVFIINMIKNTKSYDTFNFTEFDLSNVADGTYTGTEDAGLVKATVEVTIKDNVIQDVTIVNHNCGKGKPAEVIIDDVVEKNSLDVDAISGATLSSNVIKVAIYNALIQE